MDLTDFNNNYLNKILDKVSKEQKSIFLLGDFNINLLNYNVQNSTNEFFSIFCLTSCSQLELLAI